MYVRLARREEEEVRARFAAEYAGYAAATPAFFARLFRAEHDEPIVFRDNVARRF